MGKIFAFLIFLGAIYFLYTSYGYRYAVSYVVDNADSQMAIGNADSSINILAYVDYDSESSRRLFPVLLNLIASDPDVRLLIRPISGETALSQMATRLAIAAKQKGRFLDLNNAFLTANVGLDENYMEAIARSLGMDYNILKSSALSTNVEAELAEYQAEAKMLNVDIIPTFFVNHVKFTGASHSISDLNQLISDLRRGRR